MDRLRLIAGSGRSGTTWVLDAMAEANGLRPVFEPLHPDTHDIAHRFGYAYLAGRSECNPLKHFLTAVAGNGRRSIWTSYRVRPRHLRPGRRHLRSATELRILLQKWRTVAGRYWAFRARERRDAVLVKCIRANLMLDWIRTNFDSRIVLLVRHPCAVVESELRFPDHWDPYPLLARYRNDAALMGGPMGAHASILNASLTRPEALAAIWCIENVLPISQARTNGYCVIFYEELVERPDAEWPRIADGLGLRAIPDAGLVQAPSQQATVSLQKHAADERYRESHAKWQARLAASDLRHIDSILQAFGVDFYTVTSPWPDPRMIDRPVRV